MRKAFINTLIELAQKDKRIYLLTADLGFSVFENFVEEFPERFLNCGVAEQNMIGVAAGLALSGKKVYVYSMIPFVTFRCFEQIRNDVCYQNLDVKIIGIGSGFVYGSLGFTHHAIEDIAGLRALPNMTILCPADPVETRELILKSYQTKNPTYIRLAKSGEKILYNSSPHLEIGKPSVLREGKDGAIITTGNHAELGIEVIEKLRENGYNLKLISLHTLKPVNSEAILEELKDLRVVFTLEEHSIFGGLGTTVAEVLAESNWQGCFRRIGVIDSYYAEVGRMEYLRQTLGLTVDKITSQILEKCSRLKVREI